MKTAYQLVQEAYASQRKAGEGLPDNALERVCNKHCASRKKRQQVWRISQSQEARTAKSKPRPVSPILAAQIAFNRKLLAATTR